MMKMAMDARFTVVENNKYYFIRDATILLILSSK